MGIILVNLDGRRMDSILKVIEEKFNTSVKTTRNLSMLPSLVSVSSTEFILIETDSLSESLIPFLRNIPYSWSRIPIILISNYASRETLSLIKSRHPRLDGFIAKPFSAMELTNEVLNAGLLRFTALNDILVLSSEHGLRGLVSKISSQNCNLRPVEEFFRQQLFSGSCRGLFIDCTKISNVKAISIRRQLKGMNLPLALYGINTESAWTLNDLAMQVYSEKIPLTKAISNFIEISQKVFIRKVLFRKAKFCFETGNLKKARNELEMIIKIDREFAAVFSLLATVQNELGETKAATDSIKKSIELNPFHPENYIKLIKWAPAETWVGQQAKKFCPKHPEMEADMDTVNFHEGIQTVNT